MIELFNTEVAVENFGPLLAGLVITVELTLVVMALSLCFALLVALAGMSRFVWLRWVIKAYIEVMRGTPLLLQLVYIYYVLPEIGIRLSLRQRQMAGCSIQVHRDRRPNAQRHPRPTNSTRSLWLAVLWKKSPGVAANLQQNRCWDPQ